MASILVTGAAGLLGGEIAAALAERGHAVTGLVRNSRTLRRGAGEIVDTAQFSGTAPKRGEIALVSGDVSVPRLGLDEASYKSLAETTDTVIHCAAVVQFDAAPEAYDAVNLGGTANVLALAEARSQGAAGFVQVSTAYVCGVCDGAFAEDAEEAPAGFANPYEASKRAAEELVRSAMARGVPAAIARPSIVVGRQSDGAIAAFDAIYMAFKLLAEGRIGTIPASPEASLDFVPIDHVVNGILTMAERIEIVAGRAFHLVAGSPMPVGDFFDLVRSYPQFADPQLVDPQAFDVDLLPPLERRLHRKVAGLYGSYFRHNPLFLQNNTKDLLGLAGPDADLALMRRQVDYAIRAGFLRADSVPA